MRISEWFRTYKTTLIFTLTVIFVLIILISLLKFIFAKLKKGKSNKAISLLSVICNIAKFVIIVISIIIIISIWGMDPTIGLVILCTLLVIVGLGAYSLFNDMFVGMNTIFTNTYEVDDYVEINGFRGQVIEISINKTIIRSTSGEVKTITNGTIKEVTNFSKNPISASVYVPIENTRDTLEFINKLEEKLKVLKEEYPQIIEGPIVNGIEDFKDGNVIIKVSAKTKYEMKHIVERAIRKKIFELCKKYDIRIGTSKVDVKEINYE